MAKNKTWIITASGDHALKDVTERLTKTGFAVHQVMDAIGVILGSASDEDAEKARKLPGVADVSPEPPSINIGPPDAPVS